MTVANYFIDTEHESIADFDSGFSVFNDYLKQKSDSAVMHYIVEVETDVLIAYFSLLSSAAIGGELSNIDVVPAIELKMFALDKRFQKKGIAAILLESVVKVIERYALECVGANIILLYSVPVDAVVNLYDKCGFRQASGIFVTYKSPFNQGCIPMYKILDNSEFA